MNTLTVDTGVQVAITRRITSVMLKSHGGVEIKFEKVIEIPDERDDIDEDERENIEMHADDKSDVRSIPHPDFVQAFELMRAHYAILANQIGNREADLAALDDDPEFLKYFQIKGFKVTHDVDMATCQLIGTSATQYGTLSIETGKIAFGGSYKYHEELSHVIEHACDEALKYMDGKIAPTAQLDLFDDDQEDLD